MIVLLLIAITYYRLPWRKLPDPGPARDIGDRLRSPSLSGLRYRHRRPAEG